MCFCWFYILTSDSFSRNGEQLVSNWLRSGTRIDMQSHFSEITNQRNGAVFFAVRIVPLGRNHRNCRAFDFAEDLLLQRFRLSRKQ